MVSRPLLSRQIGTAAFGGLPPVADKPIDACILYTVGVTEEFPEY
jgi:hypothetical protein